MKVNAKHVVFSVIAVTTAYVMYHNERFVVQATHPAWQHYEPFKWWLLPHAVFGTIVLLFAPFQFSDRLRQRFTRAHRVMGRLYVLGAFVLALVGATALALLFAVKRKIALHRQWAIRSYAVALVFIAGRFVMGITGWEALGVEIVQAIIWSCLALSVVLADVAIHWKELRSALTVPVRPRVSRQQNVPDGAIRAT
jgi:hypothetical protein